ncbi:MAG TPA: ABC transporter permease [Rhodospirillaceae bacterium]|jgi:microcin C transport system permease protein|nr:ABC transporter permease [Alphaproteobacteria bacterium]HBH26075.1 ABC transporter permease [Rhodospirillaceae bacterium]
MGPSPLLRNRWRAFRANGRAWFSLRAFAVIAALAAAAPLIANDKPLIIWHDGAALFPVVRFYPETALGGEFATEADYKDPYVRGLIAAKGWAIWPPVPYAWDTVNYAVTGPVPSPPSADNWLGTDDQGRDVVARALYGTRLSLAFGLLLAPAAAALGILAGLMQGYYGGAADLLAQRALEVWGSLPRLLILILFSALFTPGFWTLLLILLLFSWPSLVDVVRAESLRARNFAYVLSARALGVAGPVIMLRHVLPNALVAAVSFMPFIVTDAVVALASLDFLGLGLPPGSPSLGELLAQGKNNLHAPWLGLTAFCTLAVLLTLLAFIGEGVRDALDPRCTQGRAQS